MRKDNLENGDSISRKGGYGPSIVQAWQTSPPRFEKQLLPSREEGVLEKP